MAAYTFRDIIGNKDVIRHLQSAAESGRVSHAYLIEGEEGSGRSMIADVFAKTLLCEKGGTDACNSCTSCLKASDRNHPDIIYVTHEKTNTISVGDIREQLGGTVDILPYESRYKIYIMPEAEKMTEQAQNALLKTIEEPPEYVVILLLASAAESLLATIRSRCVTLSLLPVSDREVRDYLTERLKMPDYEAKVLTAFAQGNIGRALYAATDEDFILRKNRTFSLIRSLKGMDAAAMAEAVRLMKEDRSGINDVFDILLMWYRDVLMFKATREIDQLIFTQETSLIRTQAMNASYEGLQEILDAIDRCAVRLRANVNFELALGLLLYTIKENCNA